MKLEMVLTLDDGRIFKQGRKLSEWSKQFATPKPDVENFEAMGEQVLSCLAREAGIAQNTYFSVTRKPWSQNAPEKSH